MDSNQKKNAPLRTTGGLVTGVVIGVILSMLLDSWGYLGVGIAVGLVLGGMPVVGHRQDDPSPKDAGSAA